MECNVITQSDHKQLFQSVAQGIFEFLAASPAAALPIALPGGRSVVGLLEALGAQADTLSQEIWKRIHFFMTDERLVPLSDPDSNFKLLREKLFQQLLDSKRIVETQLHPVDCTRGTVAEVISSYTKELQSVGGKYAVGVLGVGEDAHVGALFPNHHSVRELAGSFLAMTDSPKPPPHRFTSSRSLLERSDMLVALFIGEGKREAYARFKDPNRSIEECPAKILLKAKQSIAGTDLK